MPIVTLTVNNRRHELDLPPHKLLVDVLRDDVGLTGTKKGCSKGLCGSCVVLVDGRPRRSCVTQVKDVVGSDILTIEGVARGGELHPVQSAFLRQGAVQCGYCTPGMVLTAISLLEKTPHPTEVEIRAAMKGNLCRCTGYQQIVEAILEVSRGPAGPCAPPSQVIGESWIKPDACFKVKGESLYTADLHRPGMLFGKAVRSPWPHARILTIDASKAESMPGVVKVLSWKDIPGGLTYGKAMRDQPALCKDTVRFVGDPVAFVVAETEEIVLRASEQVHVDYEPLPALFSPEEALAPEAPALHEAGNLAASYDWSSGDVDQALSQADVVVENIYQTQRVEHALLETEAALAETDGDLLIVTGPTQNVFFDRREIAHVLGLPPDKVKVIQPTVGASFGKREDLYGQILCALAAWSLKRPVKTIFSREESFAVTTKRHPFRIRMRTGAMKDGTLVAQDVEILADTGAYASWAPNIIRKGASLACGPYVIPHVRVTARAAYTTQVPSGAMRGYGAPQVAFASESQMDEMAFALGMDPVAFREKNAIRQGGKTSSGQDLPSSVGLLKTLEAALEKAGPKPERGTGRIRKGRGISMILYGLGYGHGIPDIGSAVVELTQTGEILLRLGCVDYGQGSQIAMQQIAAEALGISPHRIRSVTPNTHETPDSGSTVASRQTYVSGNAVKEAASRLREEMLSACAAQWAVERSSLKISDQGVKSERISVPFSEVFEMMRLQSRKTSRQARFKASTTPIKEGQGSPYWPYAFATHIADVSVDLDTGKVTVDQLVAAHDVGKALNPDSVRGQIIGGAVMGLGYALSEDFSLDQGIPDCGNFDRYKIFRCHEVPPIHALIIEDPEPTGPFGAKGVGEPPTVAVAPAVANAVRDAIGARITQLPLTPERILEAAR